MRNLHQVLTPWVQGPRLGVDWLEEHVSEVSPRSAAVVPRTAQPGPPVFTGQGEAPSDLLGNPSREASPGPRAASFPPRSTRVHSPSPKPHPKGHCALRELKPLFILSITFCAKSCPTFNPISVIWGMFLLGLDPCLLR